MYLRHPEEALYLPTCSHLLIVNKLLSLSISISLSLSLSISVVVFEDGLCEVVYGLAHHHGLIMRGPPPTQQDASSEQRHDPKRCGWHLGVYMERDGEDTRTDLEGTNFRLRVALQHLYIAHSFRVYTHAHSRTHTLTHWHASTRIPDLARARAANIPLVQTGPMLAERSSLLASARVSSCTPQAPARRETTRGETERP